MFRHSLRRCALRASNVTSTSVVCRARPALAIPQFEQASSLRLGASVRTFCYTARMREEAEAAAADSNGGTPELLDQFADLRQLNVHENLIKTITDDMGFSTMTPVQAQTINPALKGTDIVAQAKTGTGKTLAFLLPMLQRMIQDDPTLTSRRASYRASAGDIRGIILSPTRELAEQIAVEATRLTKNTGIVVQSAVGGTNKRFMLHKTLREGCHLLVATPGRLNDLLSDESTGIGAPNLSALVLDEADRMLDVGFERELNDIIDKLPPQDAESAKPRQTMLVSATIPDNVIRLARSFIRPDQFQFVQTIPENEGLTHDKVPQFVTEVSSWGNMLPTIFEMLHKEEQRLREEGGMPLKAIIYFNTTAWVQLAGEYAFLRRRGDRSAPRAFNIHSGLTQQSRQRAADMFRQSESGILISSDVTARGMDFPNVSLVVQVDTPRDRDTYIHRVGRTGRQGKDGKGWLIVPALNRQNTMRMLRGLPLKASTELESAEYDFQGEPNQFHLEQNTLGSQLPRDIVARAYTSGFGQVTGGTKNILGEDMNDLVVKGFGWEKPPFISPSFVQKMGLNFEGMNVGRDSSRSSDDDDFGSRRGGYGDRPRRGFGGGGFGGDGPRRGYGGDSFGGRRKY